MDLNQDKKETSLKWDKWHGGQVAILWSGGSENMLRLQIREYANGTVDGVLDLQLGNRDPVQIASVGQFPHGAEPLKAVLEKWAHQFINQKWEQ